MNPAAYILPCLFFAVFCAAAFRKVKLYDSFAEGVKGVVPLLKSLFPYLAAILILASLFEASGLSAGLSKALAPVFTALGIPSEICGLVLIKPFSGSGSLALLSEILQNYGADSYIGRCACIVYSTGETVFYMSALYFAQKKEKSSALPVALAIVSNFIAIVLGCLFCRIF